MIINKEFDKNGAFDYNINYFNSFDLRLNKNFNFFNNKHNS